MCSPSPHASACMPSRFSTERHGTDASAAAAEKEGKMEKKYKEETNERSRVSGEREREGGHDAHRHFTHLNTHARARGGRDEKQGSSKQ